jgi:hypothetical protein
VYPKALRIRTVLAETSFHVACRSIRQSLELLKLLVVKYPEACLLLEENNKSPYDHTVGAAEQLAAQVSQFLLEATKDATIALCECVFGCGDIIAIHSARENRTHECGARSE